LKLAIWIFSPTRSGESIQAKQSKAKQSKAHFKNQLTRGKRQKKKRVVVGLVNPQPFFVVRFIL